ncbi:uncharacterized protein LOC118437967 [Folsomia candida]|uniref:uncharacterized protein LOC118437967 n=1 Tax=Folsomia candida TaxID=158441 RepID=UPI001604B9F4|nr:uncharacterized protein LOC118437967 [Folsomia candida]
MAEFPIEFHFDGDNYPLDGIYVEMDETNGIYSVSVDLYGFSPDHIGWYGCRARRNLSEEVTYYFLYDFERRPAYLLRRGETVYINATDEIVTLPCLSPLVKPHPLLFRDYGYDPQTPCTSMSINRTTGQLEDHGSANCPNLDELDDLTVENYHLLKTNTLSAHRLVHVNLTTYFIDKGFRLNSSKIKSPWGRYVCAVDLENNYVKFVLRREELIISPPTWNPHYKQVLQHPTKSLHFSCFSRKRINHAVMHDGFVMLPQLTVEFFNLPGTRFRYGLNISISLKTSWSFTFAVKCFHNETRSGLSPIQHEWTIEGPGDSFVDFNGATVDEIGFQLENGKHKIRCRSAYKRLPLMAVLYCANPIECMHLKNDAFTKEVTKYTDGRKTSVGYAFNYDVKNYPSGLLSCSDDYEVTHAMFFAGFEGDIYLIKNTVDIFSSYENISKNMVEINGVVIDKYTKPGLYIFPIITMDDDPLKIIVICRAKSFFFDGDMFFAAVLKNGSHLLLDVEDETWANGDNFSLEITQTPIKEKIIGKDDAPNILKGMEEGFFSADIQDGMTSTGFEGKAMIRFTSDIKMVTCSVKYRHKQSETISVSRMVELKDPILPKILTTKKTYDFKINEEKRYLSCHADGWPTPRIQWLRDGIVQPAVLHKNQEVVLSFSVVSYPDEGEYVCRAENNYGHANETFTVVVTGEDYTTQTALAITAMTLVFVSLGMFELIRRFRNRATLTEEMANQLLNEEGANMSAYNPDYEIPMERLEFDKVRLGEGAYGIVTKGYLRNPTTDTETVVAIKSCKPGADIIALRALLAEIKIMLYVGKAPNIVQILGANTSDLTRGNLYLIVEYCENGNLEKFLRNRRSFFKSGKEIQNGYTNVSPSPRNYDNVSATNTLTMQHLINWSFEIACGMEFLGEKSVVHGDLAARNILLTRRLVAKITDFGLSKQLYEDTQYTRKTKVMLPWRWMALDSLTDRCCSTCTDVWSFGVTLWEIFTLGSVPYAGFEYDASFVKKISNGLRLGKPEHASDEIYDLMSMCWHSEPNERPSFSSLKSYLGSMLSSQDEKELPQLELCDED